VIVAEPGTYYGSALFLRRRNKPSKSQLADKTISISADFANKIQKTYFRTKIGFGYRYVFGKKYPLSEYYFFEYVGNDIAQIGFINIDDVPNDLVNRTSDEINDFTDKLYDKHGGYTRAYIKDFKLAFPSTLFIGDTPGGDIGANVFVHTTKDGDVDSIILEQGTIPTAK
jgi:hypothetical protein